MEEDLFLWPFPCAHAGGEPGVSSRTALWVSPPTQLSFPVPVSSTQGTHSVFEDRSPCLGHWTWAPGYTKPRCRADAACFFCQDTVLRRSGLMSGNPSSSSFQFCSCSILGWRVGMDDVLFLPMYVIHLLETLYFYMIFKVDT